jgi:hypothetical protein
VSGWLAVRCWGKRTVRRLGLFIPLSILALAAPALGQYVKMYGMVVAPCSEASCASLGMDVRVLPWNVEQYRQMAHSKESGEPYLPLSAQENAALSHLLTALLKPQPAKTAFESIPVELRIGFNHRASTFSDFRDWASSRSCTAQTYSLTLPEDKRERYGLIRFNCTVDGKKAENFASVALQQGDPVRIYVGSPVPVYGSAAKTHPEPAR